jgi:hypothetical protein
MACGKYVVAPGRYGLGAAADVHVVTNVARFSRALPSSMSSS